MSPGKRMRTGGGGAEGRMREWGRHEERRMDMITSWKLRFEGKTWEAGGRQGARGEPEVQTKTTSQVTEFIVWAGKKRRANVEVA